MTSETAAPTTALGRLAAPPFVGILAFVAVLGIVPLMHSVLQLVMDAFPEGYDTPVSLGIGGVAVAMMIYGSLSKSEAVGTCSSSPRTSCGPAGSSCRFVSSRSWEWGP